MFCSNKPSAAPRQLKDLGRAAAQQARWRQGKRLTADRSRVATGQRRLPQVSESRDLFPDPLEKSSDEAVMGRSLRGGGMFSSQSGNGMGDSKGGFHESLGDRSLLVLGGAAVLPRPTARSASASLDPLLSCTAMPRPQIMLIFDVLNRRL
jgi:hypothetical protein